MTISEWMQTPLIDRAKLDKIHDHLVAKLVELHGRQMEIPIYFTVVLDDPNPQPHPAFQFEKVEGETLAITLVPPGQEEQRKQLIFKWGRDFPYAAAKAVLLTSTAWMSTRPPDDPKPDVLPADDPNRREILLVGDMALGLFKNCRITCIDMESGERKNNVAAGLDVLTGFWVGLSGCLGRKGVLTMPAKPKK